MAVILGITIVAVLIGNLMYNTGSKMLASKKTTPELKS